jgi:hypothetical protein
MLGTNDSDRRAVRSAVCLTSGRGADAVSVSGLRVGGIDTTRAGHGGNATSMELVEQRRAELIALVRGAATVIEPSGGPRWLTRVAEDAA